MKYTTFYCTALLAAIMIFFGTGTLEAKRHSHYRVNVGTGFFQRPAVQTVVVRPVYAQPVYVAQPVYAVPQERVVVYQAPVYQEVVTVPTTPRFNLFSFGFSFGR